MNSAHLIYLVAGLQFCLASLIDANWILTAMFVKNRHCDEIIELIQLDLVSESDITPKSKVLRKGYVYCKDYISRHKFTKMTDDERLLYSIIGTITKENLPEFLHELSEKTGTSIEVQAKRAFLVSCAAGNISAIDQTVNLLPGQIINLGFVLACSRRQLQAVEFLLDHVTPDRNLLERSMKIACMLGSLLMVTLLLDNFEFDDSGYLAAAAYGGSLELVQHLMSDPRFNDDDGISEALRWAVRMDHIHVAEYILEQRVASKQLALKHACKNNKFDLAQKLIDRYQDLNLRAGFNAACAKGHLEIIKLLMATGRIDVDSDTLYYAAHSGNIELAAWILAQPGIDVNLKKNSATLFSSLLEDRIPLKVLEQLMRHEAFTADTLLSAFSMEESRNLLHLPVTHRMLFRFKGDLVMRALSCGATIKGLLALFCHPCIPKDQISSAAHILDIEETPMIMDKLRIIIACKSGDLERCIEICVYGDVPALIEIGIQCAAAHEQSQILAHLLKVHRINTSVEGEGVALLPIDNVVGMCRSLGATASVRFIWEWLSKGFPLILDTESSRRPFQIRVIRDQIDTLTMNQHLDVICQRYETVVNGFRGHLNLVRLAKCYRDHFLIMISIYEACPLIPLEYSEEILTTMLKAP